MIKITYILTGFDKIYSDKFETYNYFKHFVILNYNNLTHLNCSDNNLIELPELPSELVKLSCCYNKLTYLPMLPQKLKALDCSCNNLIDLPELPQNLEILYCYINKLTKLPDLPNNLITLYCNDNYIININEIDMSFVKHKSISNQTERPKSPLILPTVII